MLKCWEEIRLNKEKSHSIEKLKGQSKGKTGNKCHMVPLVYTTYVAVVILVTSLYGVFES